jgi:hypothetical protein
MSKLTLLTKDIQAVLIKLNKNHQNIPDIFDENSKLKRIDHQFSVVKKYDLLQKSHLLQLEILLYVEFITLLIDKKKKNQAFH